MVTGGSDNPAVVYDPDHPLLGLTEGYQRHPGRQASAGRGDLARAVLRMYTINNAYATFQERVRGSIEPGKLADLVVLEDDILTCPVEKIKGSARGLDDRWR